MPEKPVRGVRGSSCQAPLGRPARELMAGGQLQLAQHRGDVGFHRLDRDEQLPGDLLVGVTTGDQPQHLTLAPGELVQFRIEGRGLGAGAVAKASRTKPASRGEKNASPAATRRTASTRSVPEIVLVT